VRGWYSRLCSSIVVSLGVRHYGGKVDVLDLVVVFGWGFYVGWLWANSTPPKRSLEEMRPTLMLTQGASSPMTARAKNRKNENSGGNELANRAVPDVQPGSAPRFGTHADFAVNCRV
jgi:hypothetical protein